MGLGFWGFGLKVLRLRAISVQVLRLKRGRFRVSGYGMSGLKSLRSRGFRV